MVALTGALLNSDERLARIESLRRKLLRQAAHSPRPVRQIRPRSGVVQTAVTEVLNAAPEPMSVKDVHAAVEHLLTMPVSTDTVNSCLSTGARGSGAQFERVKVGVYQLRPSG